METISAAALPIDDKKSIDDNQKQLGKKKPMKKSMPDHPKMFSKKDYEAWINPCSSDGIANGVHDILAHVDRAEAYQKVSVSVRCEKNDINWQKKSSQITELFLSLSLPLSLQFSLFSQIKLSVETVKVELKNSDKINTTNYEAFDFFNAPDYEFLPTKPTVSFSFMTFFATSSREHNFFFCYPRNAIHNNICAMPD